MNEKLNIQTIPLSKLNPAKYNARKDLKPTDPEYKKIKASINGFGYLVPIVWNEVTGNIVGGHQRYKILKASGATEADVEVVHIENEDDEKALSLALNKATGAWEPQALADLLNELQLSGYNTDKTAFDAPEIDMLFSIVYDKNVINDEIDQIDQNLGDIEPIVEPGDVWTLGRHRLMCGDSSNPENMLLLFGKTKANLIVCDRTISSANAGLTMKYAAEHAVNGCSAYVFYDERDEYEGLIVREAFWNAGFYMSGVCIWDKGIPRNDGLYYRSTHETILYGWLPTGAHRWYADRKQTTIWDFKCENPTIKPVMLLAYPIKNSSAPNSVIADIGGTAGSVMLACEQLRRRCFAMEEDPKRATIAILRFAKFTEKTDEIKLYRNGVAHNFYIGELLRRED